MPSPEKFRKTLDEFNVSPAIIDEIYCGFGQLNSKTNKKIKYTFFCQALNVMNEKLSPETVQDIFESNACCKSGFRLKTSKEFARIHADLSIAERLKLISSRPYMNMGKAELDEDNHLVVHAVSYHPGEKFECACPTISKIQHNTPLPREYCYCCGGHFKFHYEIMLESKLKLIEIISSPHDTNGEKACAFRYKFIGLPDE